MKYKITISVETNEKLDGNCLEGCWLYDEDFDGAITDVKIKSVVEHEKQNKYY